MNEWMNEKNTLDHRPGRVLKPKHSSPKFVNLVKIYPNTRIDKCTVSLRKSTFSIISPTIKGWNDIFEQN